MTTQALAKASNFEFEVEEIGEVPVSWASPTRHGGYTVRLTEKAPKRGSRCAEIAKSEVNETPKAPFGNVMRMIDATPFRGKRLKFTGWARKAARRFANRLDSIAS